MTSETLSPKAVVEAAMRLFEEMRGLEAIERYFSRDYIEHNPTIKGGGLDGFVQLLIHEGFTGPNDRGFEFHVHHVLSENDLVFVHQHVTEPGKPALFIMDLYRVDNGKIVEHWDVMQTAPADPANTRHAMY